MKCNTFKCKELVFRKKRNATNYPVIYNIAKLCEANKCLFIIRGLRGEGYSQDEAIVLVKITYGLPVYGASEADLNIIQCFLKRCFKGLCELLDIRQLLEEKDRKKKRKKRTDSCHSLNSME